MTAGLPAENPVFVLKGNNVESRAVQKLGRLHIIADRFGANLKTYSRGIVTSTTFVGHGDDASLETRAGGRHSAMKIMGKCSNPAAARKMISNEGHTPSRLHLVVSWRPILGR